MGRIQDLIDFYDLLGQLEQRVGGTRTLAECNGHMAWPHRGVYFFFEPGENRSDSGSGLRVVRVGTHALASKSRTSLWNRLSQHRGVEKTGGGNHRGSIFRGIVGAALKKRNGDREPRSWGVASDPGAAAKKLKMETAEVIDGEMELERTVSQHIRQMPFLWLAVDDSPGPASLRGIVERNAIALLSNYRGESLDPASRLWLGSYPDRDRVQKSGLWNSNHVDEVYDLQFLSDLERLILGPNIRPRRRRPIGHGAPRRRTVSNQQMLTTLTGKREIAEAQRLLSEAMTSRCDRSEDVQLGFQGGGLPARVHWNSRLNIWMAFRRVEKRFWSAFGIGNPFCGNSKSIVVEINFPFQGISRRIGGLFLRDSNDQIYLGHRGRVGGGRRGIGKKAFLEFIRPEDVKVIKDGDKRSEIILLGAIDVPTIDERVAEFVHSVARFKKEAVRQFVSRNR